MCSSGGKTEYEYLHFLPASEDGNNVAIIIKTRTIKEVQISNLKPCVMHCQITLCYENASLWGGDVAQYKLS